MPQTLKFFYLCNRKIQQKVQLPLAQKDEWEEYFMQESAKVSEIAQQISQTDKEIDQMVYELYGLTPEEIAVVEKG